MNRKNTHTLGIDLAKNVFQLHRIDNLGQVCFKGKLSRNKLLAFLGELSPCIVAMEACSGSHYWSRKATSFGHEVRMIAPQFVKPFVKGNKNDAADAEAITEAAMRPSMRFVSVKTPQQQDINVIHRVRQRLIHNRTQLANQIRGILAEYGIVMAKGRQKVGKLIQNLLAGEQSPIDLTPLTMELLGELWDEWNLLEDKISRQNVRIAKISAETEECQKLEKITGIGKIISTALVAVMGSPHNFKNGRQFAAFLGLVPKHKGTGGNNRIGKISKRGNVYLRTLLIHGARSALRVILYRFRSGTSLLGGAEKRFYGMYEKKGYNKTCVALANKIARVCWALLAKDEEYSAQKAFCIV